MESRYDCWRSGKLQITIEKSACLLVIQPYYLRPTYLAHRQNWSSISVSDTGAIGAALEAGGHIWVYEITFPPTGSPTNRPTTTSQFSIRPTSQPSISIMPTKAPTYRPTMMTPSIRPTSQPTMAYNNCTPIMIKTHKYQYKASSGSKMKVTYTVKNTGKTSINNLAFEVDLPPGTKFVNGVAFPKIKGHRKAPMVTKMQDDAVVVTWPPSSLNEKKSRHYTVTFKIDLCASSQLTTRAFTYQQSSPPNGPTYCNWYAKDIRVSQ